LTALAFLLLVPATVFIAENATTGDMTANTSDLNITINATMLNQSLNETNASLIMPVNVSNETSQEPLAANPSINDTSNETLPAVNDTNATITDNATSQEPGANVTLPDSQTATDSNTTLPGNRTQDNQNTTDEVSPLLGPDLDVSIDIPGQADRGESFRISCSVENKGDSAAGDVRIEWDLPSSIVVLEGDKDKTCGTLQAGSSCESSLVVGASRVSRPGRHEIMARVTYHE
jgi:hypothetical protein